jgi:hypothetical protein
MRPVRARDVEVALDVQVVSAYECDPASVRRPRRIAFEVVAVREPLRVGAVGARDIQVVSVGAGDRHERDPLAVGRNRWILGGRVG